jgi:hypothetical protein
MTTTNREDWLSAAVSELRPFFDAVGAPLPANVRVTCGFPSNAKRSGAIGECWADTASADKTFEVLISPVLDDPLRVFDVLVHELCHATAGAMNHGINFQKLASAMLLVPAVSSFKATVQAPSFMQAYAPILEGLGAYPHAPLDLSVRKTQGTRMLKAYCPSCGYTIRLTAKWAYDAHGDVCLPTCPCGDDFTL